ncbi:MAG: threonine/serine exporter family protein, partial [Bacteroidaceae bacterium]|nr:threonine/serine exporter family protein [Bacteroidaceae bacterium]
TIAVAFTARELAVWQRCPMTVFLICGIFPLVPGAGIYWTSYYVISGHLHAALTAGFTAIKVVIAIIFGIVFTTDVIFRFLKRRRKTRLDKVKGRQNTA